MSGLNLYTSALTLSAHLLSFGGKLEKSTVLHKRDLFKTQEIGREKEKKGEKSEQLSGFKPKTL